MPKSPNQKRKLLIIRQLLLERTDENHWLSLDAILKALEAEGIQAERKSIYDDLHALEESGMDILQMRGKNGGYYLASRDFELAELKLLVDAIQASRFVTHRKSNELIRKLESLVSHPQARELHRQVYVTGRSKTVNESIYYNVDALHTAISENRQIRFRYFRWQLDFRARERFVKQYGHDGANYLVSPWALLWDDENYYLVAFDQKDGIVKHYRVDRMERIELVDCPREGQAFFERLNPADYSRKTFGMFSGETQRVQFKCKNQFAGVLYDRFGDELSLMPCDAEHFYASVNVAVSPQFFAWVFGLDGAIEIVQPRAVAEEYRAMLHRTLGEASVPPANT